MNKQDVRLNITNYDNSNIEVMICAKVQLVQNSHISNCVMLYMLRDERIEWEVYGFSEDGDTFDSSNEIQDLNELSEEEFFQYSLLWEHNIDIHLVRSMQKYVLSKMDLSNKLDRHFKDTLEY